MGVQVSARLAEAVDAATAALTGVVFHSLHPIRTPVTHSIFGDMYGLLLPAGMLS
jgi:hypothetical protein